MGKMEELKPALLMLLVQISFSAMNVLYKLSLNDGMSASVISAYRLIFASSCTVPLALILEGKTRAKLTWRVLFMSFISGLFGGSLFQNLYLISMELISATFTSAMFNLIPGVTFILGVAFGIEKLNLHKAADKARVLGTITGIGGAMMLTFLKGVELYIWPFHLHIMHKRNTGPHGHNKVLGILSGLASCFSYSFWLIIQARISKEYPSHYSSTALMSIMGAAQATVFALCIEKDWSQWRLGWSIRLLTAIYSGTVASGIMIVVVAWCVRKKGPLYTSVFAPVMLVVVAIVGNLMLDEKLYAGSALGAIFIMIGLYMVLWGSSTKVNSKITPEIQQIHVVSVTTATAEHDNISRSSNISESNVVSK